MKTLRIQGVDIRKTHPALYRTLMVVASMGIALSLNFWLSHPTFNPYGISKNVIGVVFFLLGFSQLVFLNVVRDLRMVRLNVAVSIAWMMFWGLSNAQQFIAGKASLQLPILFITLSILQIPWSVEAPVNPMTERK